MYSPTQESVEAYAASVREYYAMLKAGVSLEQQGKLIQRMHSERDKLLMSVLIDYGQIGLIRYVRETRALLEKRRQAHNTEEKARKELE